jgi:hypothetical protein
VKLFQHSTALLLTATVSLCRYRETCRAELQLIMERTAERHRILTLCSSAANQRRIYDKSLIEKLQACTTWINKHKEDVVEAYVLAAKNTYLGTVQNAQVRCCLARSSIM